MIKKVLLSATVLVVAVAAMTACTSGGGSGTSTTAQSSAESSKADDSKKSKADESKESKADESKESKADDKAPAVGGGFEEFPLGEDVENGPLVISGVYFQPVDMEPAGNSIAKEDADCHIEADITASDEGASLGYGAGDFVPWLHVKAYIQKEGSDKVQEVAFMPMNASDGPHYGANIKFEEGLGKYKIKFEVGAPGNDYLLHVDKETGVTGRFWTEPLVAEWDDFEWQGPQWQSFTDKYHIKG